VNRFVECVGPEIQEMSLDRKTEDEAANSRLERNSYTSGRVCTGAVKDGKHFTLFSDQVFHSVVKFGTRAGSRALGPTPCRPLCIVARAIIK